MYFAGAPASLARCFPGWETGRRRAVAASVAVREAAESHRRAEAHHPSSANVHRLARTRISSAARSGGVGITVETSPSGRSSGT